MVVRAIIACDDAYGIGNKGTIPWPANKHDLKWFKDATDKAIVVMGKNTWEDPKMPKPLANRFTIVVSKSSITEGYNRKISNYDCSNIIKKYKEDVWIIGGATLIKSCLNIIDEVWLSIIPSIYTCDTFLPIKEIEKYFIIFEEFKNTDLNIKKYIKCSNI